jgi:hypothetical protein
MESNLCVKGKGMTTLCALSCWHGQYIDLAYPNLCLISYVWTRYVGSDIRINLIALMNLKRISARMWGIPTFLWSYPVTIPFY